MAMTAGLGRSGGSQEPQTPRTSIQSSLKLVSRKITFNTGEKFNRLMKLFRWSSPADQGPPKGSAKAGLPDPEQRHSSFDTPRQDSAYIVFTGAGGRDSTASITSSGPGTRAAKSDIQSPVEIDGSGSGPWPAPRELNGRMVHVVDTSVCVGRRQLSQQSSRDGIRRSNAIRGRDHADRLRGEASGSDRASQPTWLDRLRDEVQSRGKPGVELLPPHPDILAMLRRDVPEPPSAFDRSDGMFFPRRVYATGVEGGDERSPCRALPTLEDAPLTTFDDVESVDGGSDDDMPLQQLRRRASLRRHVARQLLDDTATSSAHVRSIVNSIIRPQHAIDFVEGPSHAVVIHRSTSVHSQPATLVTEDTNFDDFQPLDDRTVAPFFTIPTL